MDFREQLRRAVERMEGYIEEQLDSDPHLTIGVARNAPLDDIDAGLQHCDTGSLLDAGRAAADWILAAASDEERLDWAVGMPHPDIDAFEVAAAAIQDEAPACEILEAGHETCRFDPDVTHTVCQLAEDDSSIRFAPGLYFRQPGRWYVVELIREDGPGFCEVVDLLAVAGPYESALVARFEQLRLAPLSLRPAPCDPLTLGADDGDLSPTLPLERWAQEWATQHFASDNDAFADAANGYFAAVSSDGSRQEGRGSVAWTLGWTAGCAARMLGCRGLRVAVVRETGRSPHQFWSVVRVRTGSVIPSLTHLPSSVDAAKLAAAFGVLAAVEGA